MLSILHPFDKTLSLLQPQICRILYLINNRVIEHKIFVCIKNIFLKVIKNIIGLVEHIHNHELVGMRRLVIITIVVQIKPRIEEFLHLHAVLGWVAYLVVVDTHFLDEKLRVETDIGHIDGSAISHDVVYFVHIN